MAIGTPTAAGVIVNAADGTSVYTGTTTQTVPADEDLIVILGWVSDPARTGTVTVSGKTPVRLGFVNGTESGTVDLRIEFWRVPGGVTSGTTVTATASGGTFGMAGSFFRQAGLRVSSPLDSTPTSTLRTTTTVNWSTPGLTTTNANDMLYGIALCDSAADAVNTPTGTLINELANYEVGTNNIRFVVDYAIVSSTGTYTANGTWSQAPNFADLTYLLAIKDEPTSTPANLTGTAAGTGAAVGFPSAGLTYLAAGTAATAGNGDVVASYPDFLTLQTNDILICDVSTRDNVVLTFPAGWTKKAELNNGATLRQTIAWKRRAGGDSDTNVTVTHTAGAQIIARVHVIRGAITSGDPFETSGGPTAVASATTGTFPTATTAVDGDLLFYAMAYGDDYATGPSVTNAQSLTLTERDSTEVP